ncbi:XRE family transcriptional regulator [Verrucomicrobia bacterium LW23]|nr:XRE family transcriptional regulator [Verrucomicrobia bacterium LW23]
MKRPRNIVGPQVRRVRAQIGLSQPQLAAKCQLIGWDVGRDAIAKIEGQTRWVADFELLNLAKALETHPMVLLSVDAST